MKCSQCEHKIIRHWDLCTVLPSPIHPHQNKVERMERKGKHFVFSVKFEPLPFLCPCWSLVFGPYVSCIPIRNPHASLEDGFSTLSQAYHWTLTTCVSPNPTIKTSVFTGEADELACQPWLRLKYLLSASGYPGVERAGLELQINTSTLFFVVWDRWIVTITGIILLSLSEWISARTFTMDVIYLDLYCVILPETDYSENSFALMWIHKRENGSRHCVFVFFC